MARIINKKDGTLKKVPITADKVTGVLTIDGKTYNGSENVEVEVVKMTIAEVDALFDDLREADEEPD